ncbi:MAG: PspC domain-containing protein [Candidatus Micrarchaeota archaeon]|nr:PspC domain-containing protein [Candidatus Micrarchaeota archaeon]
MAKEETGVKKLYRSKKNRMFAGVCGGIAEYFGIDPMLVRLLFVLAGFAGSAGLIIYLVVWFMIPENPNQ